MLSPAALVARRGVSYTLRRGKASPLSRRDGFGFPGSRGNLPRPPATKRLRHDDDQPATRVRAELSRPLPARRSRSPGRGISRICRSLGFHSQRALRCRLRRARGLTSKEESALLLDLAPLVDAFVGELFGISAQLAQLRGRHHDLAPLYDVKRQFVQRRAASAFSAGEAAGFDGEALTQAIAGRIDAYPGTDPSLSRSPSRTP